MSINQGSLITANDVNNHINNKSNPHEVTAAQIGAMNGSGNLVAGTDFNTVTTSGIYRFNNENINGPGIDWGQLLVMHGGGDTITQIVGDFSSGNLYTRSGNPSDIGGAGAWTAWQKLVTQNELNSSSLPAVSSANEGQVLRVINGQWAVANAVDSETFTGFVTVTHSFSDFTSTMSISGVPFQPSKPWKSCIASIALLNDATDGSYTLNSYGSVGTNSNVLLVGGYCRTGHDTFWTYQTWYLKLNSTGDTLSWVTANSNRGDNHSGSGSFSWTFTVNITGYFA